MNVIIGTGGHIDHGKTALVGALTGADTDRLPEEKRRGISIDLGFTRLQIGDLSFGIVDVPGHEDFIRNMLAGATGFDLLLLVVAADEGVMPQTREHVAIAELLGIPAAVVALSRTDLVSDEWLELARDDVAGYLAGSAFADAPIIPTSATTGEGVDALRDAIVQAVPANRRDDQDLFRLPADRVFTVRGTGTVVTGTVWSGALDADATVRIAPGGHTARVRGLQVHGEEVGRIGAGQRAAVALAGVDRDAISRGVSLVTHDAWSAASILTVRLGVLPGTTWSIQQRQRVRVHLGTAEVLGRVRLLDSERLEPGQEGWAQLRLEAPLLARAGDRFVVRSYSPVTTIGGGRIAEPSAPRRKRLDPALTSRLARRTGGDLPRALVAVVEDAGRRGALLERLPVEAGAPPEAVRRWLAESGLPVAGGRVFPDTAAADVAGELRAAVQAYHQARPLRRGIPLDELRRAVARTDPALVEHVVADLAREEDLVAAGELVSEPGFTPRLEPAERTVAEAILGELAAAGPAPPSTDELAHHALDADQLQEVLAFLEAEGEIVRIQPGVYLHNAVLERLVADVTARLAGHSGLGPADFRPVINVSRKHLIPILEHLDIRGVTVRQGDARDVPAR